VYAEICFFYGATTICSSHSDEQMGDRPNAAQSKFARPAGANKFVMEPAMPNYTYKRFGDTPLKER